MHGLRHLEHLFEDLCGHHIWRSVCRDWCVGVEGLFFLVCKRSSVGAITDFEPLEVLSLVKIVLPLFPRRIPPLCVLSVHI